MRFKNRYYLVEIRWESVAGGGNVAAANAASAAAGSSSASTAPSLRHVDLSLQSYQLLVSLREAIQFHFGDLVLGRLNQSLGVRYLNTLTNLAIIRCARADHRAVGATLSFVTSLRNRGVIFKTIHLAGTIRSCQKAAVKLQRRRMGELRELMQRAEEELAATAAAAAAGSVATGSALTSAEHATLSAAIVGTTARTNQAAAKNAQQVFRQLSLLLSQYNAARAAAAAATAASSSSMAASSASAAAAASLVAPVAANPAAISAALDQVLSQSEEEIMAMET